MPAKSGRQYAEQPFPNQTVPNPTKDRPMESSGLTVPVENEESWRDDPDLIRKFNEQKADYELLCAEIVYSVDALAKASKIRINSVSSRTKSLESFLEKLERKSYNDPFTEITDFAGVRVVCFYEDDIARIESLIRKQFRVVEADHKGKAIDVDRFGYNATHFLVYLGDSVSGPRYDSLRELVCEIQVRTVLQDAWAIFTHHLMYKHEDQIPDSIKRELHALSGALETADTAFQAIRDKRDRYIESVNQSTERECLVSVSTNLDSLREYLLREFPGQKLETHHGELSQILQTLPRHKYPTLKQIDDAIEATREARPWFYEASGSATQEDGRSATFEMIRALWIVDEELRDKTRIVKKQKEMLRQAREMIPRDEAEE